MRFWNALKAALRHDLPPAGEIPAADTLRALESRLAALEDIQVRRELEWAETKSALDRMLKRAAALDQRAREREPERNGRHATVEALLKAKGLLKEG